MSISCRLGTFRLIAWKTYYILSCLGLVAKTLLYEADGWKENLEAQFTGACHSWLSHGLHHHREVSDLSFSEHLHSRML